MNDYEKFKQQLKIPGVKTIYFCHYPKTGGTYFKNIVFNTINGVDNINSDIVEKSYVAKEFKKKGIIIKLLGHGEDYKKYKKKNTFLITTVRDPLEILKSYYSHGREGFGNLLRNNNINNFNDYVELQLEGKINNLLIENYFFKDMFYKDKLIFDLVFKLENIEKDLIDFFNCFNLDISKINFNMNEYDKNSFFHDRFDSNYPMDHKKERKNLIIDDKLKEKIIKKYNFFYDFFNYK